MSNRDEAAVVARGKWDERISSTGASSGASRTSGLATPRKEAWKRGHSVAITAKKLKKWCVLVHFGASQRLGTRLRRDPPCGPQSPGARFFRASSGELFAL